MIKGLGNDIVQISRVREIYEKRGYHFIKNILTPKEIELLNDKTGKAEFIAGRWAAKEAFSKALGTGMCEQCAFVEIELLPDSKGAPHVTLHAETAVTAAAKGIVNIHVSISHEKDYAVATVILED